MNPFHHAAVCLVPAFLLLGGVVVHSAEEPLRKTIAVSGLGTVMSTPNVADIQVGVASRKATAQEALSANATDMAMMQKRANGNGVKDDDIQTSQFSLLPVYSQVAVPPPGQSPVQAAPRVVGYEVQHIVRITARDLSKLGPLLDTLVGAGANQIYGVDLRAEAPDLMKEARRKAMADARSKAEQLAACEGLTIGEPVTIREDFTPSYPIPPSPMGSYALAAPEMGRTSISAGEKETRVSISVVFELNKKAQ